jgi:hypothetical protein
MPNRSQEHPFHRSYSDSTDSTSARRIRPRLFADDSLLTSDESRLGGYVTPLSALYLRRHKKRRALDAIHHECCSVELGISATDRLETMSRSWFVRHERTRVLPIVQLNDGLDRFGVLVYDVHQDQVAQ